MTGTIRAVLSDAGGVLFDFSFETQIEPLRILLEKDGKKLSSDEVSELYLPYLYKAQTTISEEEAINQFLRDYSCSTKFIDYEKIRSLMVLKNQETSLFEGVTETLEALRHMHIDFYVVTNAKKRGVEFKEDFDKMLIAQLQERGVYNPKTFDSLNYVRATISSKDLGVRKPEVVFFDAILSLGRYTPLKRNEIVFIAHANYEIFGAADLGIPVIAFNYQREKDAQDIVARIDGHNEKYNNGQKNSRIYTIEKFPEIPKIITELK